MAHYKVGLGSSIQRELNLRRAIVGLGKSFSELMLSPVYEAAAVGFDGDPFLNLVAGFTTDWSLPEVCQRIKQLESESGRTGTESKCSGRTLDIDILTLDRAVGIIHGVELPRGEILENAYVLQPLADLAPDEIHPVSGRTFAWHWQHFMGPRVLQKVEFSWIEPDGKAG